MVQHILKGYCHCKNIKTYIQISFKPENYSPRICDCDFCYLNGVMVLSDPTEKGRLKLIVEDEYSISHYTHGSQSAKFMICKTCGVVAAVFYKDEAEDELYGAINIRTLDKNIKFANPLKVSPKSLDGTEKIKRWKNLWFKGADIMYKKPPKEI